MTGLYDSPCPININPLEQSAVVTGWSRWSTVKHYRCFFQSHQQGLQENSADGWRQGHGVRLKTDRSLPVCHTSPLGETSLLEAHRPVWYQTHSLCILGPLDAPRGACPKTPILQRQHSACCSADVHKIKRSWVYCIGPCLADDISIKHAELLTQLNTGRHGAENTKLIINKSKWNAWWLFCYQWALQTYKCTVWKQKLKAR